ncbi:MAG: CDP-alcohol phosphatidyltransferase family protein [Rhodospirillales bacterium]|nr:CDP-alcohol phosphatidyltransferase family protein [Rhodospirillales bacterium]
MNLPNLITFARICSVPVIVWLIVNNQLLTAFWVTMAAGISDAVDGIVAKRFDLVTELGAFLDPIADKALLMCLFIALGHQGYLEVWLVILVVFRDLLILGGALLFHTLTHSLTIQPLKISKVNTFAQMVLAVGVLGMEGYAIDAGNGVAFLTVIVAFTTICSGAGYVYLWAKKAAEFEGDDSRDSQEIDE